MATIDDLNISISELPYDAILELIKVMRERRRTPINLIKKVLKIKTKKITVKENSILKRVDDLDKEGTQRLLDALLGGKKE